MNETIEPAETVREALLQGANIARVIDLRLVDLGEEGVLVCAKVDLPADRTMREVSAILLQAERRVQRVLPEATQVFIEPDVWIDPNATAPTTSSVVMLGID